MPILLLSLVTFPDLPEPITQGDDESDALVWALDALETVLGIYMDERKLIPYPSPANGLNCYGSGSLTL
jgi:antitoxin HicB